MPQIMAASSPKAAVAVNFAEVGEHALDVVERIRAIGMARQFRALPGSQLARHLAAQRFHAFVQPLQLLLRFLIVAGSALQLLDLLLDLLQFVFALVAASIWGSFRWLAAQNIASAAYIQKSSADSNPACFGVSSGSSATVI